MKNLLKLRYFLRKINAPEDLDAESSAHPEVNKYQDAVATTDPEGPEYMDVYSSFLPEVPEDRGVLCAGARYEGNTQKTSDYDTTMDLDVANINKKENNTCRNMYEAIGKHYFV